MFLRPSGSAPSVIPDYIRLPGKNPYTGGDDGEVLISRDMLEDLENNGPTQKFWDVCLIPDNLENPVVILEGLNRPGFENGFCYSSVPTCRWKDEQTKMAPPPLKVFLTFVHPRGNDLFVLDWEWRFVDLSRPGYPKNWRRDYVRQKWPPTN